MPCSSTYKGASCWVVFCLHCHHVRFHVASRSCWDCQVCHGLFGYLNCRCGESNDISSALDGWHRRNRFFLLLLGAMDSTCGTQVIMAPDQGVQACMQPGQADMQLTCELAAAASSSHVCN